MGDMRYIYKMLVRKPEGKRSLGRAGRRWEDNITMKDYRETELEVVDWVHLVQDRGQCWAVVSTVMNLRVAQKAGNLLDGDRPIARPVPQVKVNLSLRLTKHHAMKTYGRMEEWRYSSTHS